MDLRTGKCARGNPPLTIVALWEYFLQMAVCFEASPAELARKHDKLRRKLIRSTQHSPLATIVTDATKGYNHIIAVNQAFEKLSGYSEAEILGQNCRILSGVATSAASRAILHNAIEAGAPAFVTLVNYRKDGEPFDNAVMVAPVYDEFGTLAFFLGTQLKVESGSLDVKTAKARLATLTTQQLRVLEKMAHGLRHADIAKDLSLSIKTVKMHRGALVQRLGVVTSTEAIRIAVEAGL